MAPSIQGSNGSGDLMRAARAMVWGFGLDRDTATRLMMGEWNQRCTPPWTEGEIERACGNVEDGDEPRGHLRDAPLRSSVARGGSSAAGGPALESPAGPVDLGGLGSLAGEPVAAERNEIAEGAAKDTPPAELLMNSACEIYELFVDGNGIAYASRDRITAEPIEARAFKNDLINLYRRLLPGTVPGAEVIRNVIASMVATAARSEPREVYIRTAFVDGCVYFHADRSVVYQIDGDGWRPCAKPPVRFRWPKTSLPVLVGDVVGDVSRLRRFANLEDDNMFPLLVAWLTATIRGGMPIPILTLLGNQGTAKSTLARLLVSLVDPRSSDLRGQPDEIEQLMIAARNAWVLGYDNFSYIGPELADGFCRLVTGGALTKRALYTDADESTFSARRPVIINGIEEPSTRGDLLERMLTVRLRPIAEADRKTEEELANEVASIRPVVVAGLFDRVSAGLRDSATVSASLPLPRLADFGRWVAAVEGEEVVTGLLADSNRSNAENALEGNPIMPALAAFLADISLPGTWRGTASELHREVTGQARNLNGGQLPNRWPSTPHHLTGMIRRIAPQLEQIEGWFVEFARTKTAREVHFRRRQE